MYLTPLDSPAKQIPLHDPFIEFFVNGVTLTKDLFFSGHTSTMCILFFTAEYKWLKGFLLICILLIATFVTLQHAHYVVDVFIAPFIAFTSYWIVTNARRKNET